MAEPAPTFQPEALVSALADLPWSAWRAPQAGPESVNPGYRFAPLITGGWWKVGGERWRFVLDEFAPVWTAWLAIVPAGGFIAPHIDEGPFRERWHVPVIVAGTFNDEACEAGVAFPVQHWLPHKVDNPTDIDRVHLVIDRDVWVDVPDARFQRVEEAP